MTNGVKVVLLILVGIIIALGVIFFTQKEEITKRFFHKAELKISNKYDSEEIKHIEIDLISSDIIINKSYDNIFNLEVYAQENEIITVDVKDNTLRIKADPENMCIGICNGNKVLLEIPETYIGNFDLKTVSGDISSTIVEPANNYKVTVTSGDINLDSVTNIDVATTSGDINIKNLYGYINATGVSSDIAIDNFVIHGNSTISLTSGDIEIDKIEGAKIDASTVSGDLRVSDNDDEGEYTLKISTISGDVKVNE